MTSFYAAASAWPDADRTLADSLDQDRSDPGFNGETTTINELGVACELQGSVQHVLHRTEDGPDGAHRRRRSRRATRSRRRACGGVRYPVLYVLHGYGQDPRDLEATAAITSNYMNDSQRSAATRLAKMIVVYVDGRCRIDPTTQQPECIQGTFYLNSPRSVNGHPMAQLDDWFEEVMTYIDANYRTMPASGRRRRRVTGGRAPTRRGGPPAARGPTRRRRRPRGGRRGGAGRRRGRAARRGGRW